MSTCCTVPSRITATREPSVVASTWSCVKYTVVTPSRWCREERGGSTKMTNVISRLSETPGSIRHPGRRHGEDTDTVLAELGVGPEELERLRRTGAV